mmetsp:Transcript_121602/g.192489  ORF Transcript_121602/g.192489 Transcript_121602/m.192489 type:complete len:734 (+) Transcript_121602:63-2264(+)
MQIPQMGYEGLSYNKMPADNGRKSQRGKGDRGAGRGGKSAPQAKQGGITFPWINGQIVAAAESGNIHQLVTVITSYLPQMNLVNLSTGLHRLAKLSGGDARTHTFLKQGLLPVLLNSTQQALLRSQMSGSLPKCQALSNITWALATMHVIDLPLLHLVATFSYYQLTSFKNFELCQLLWAFAKLGTLSPDLSASTTQLFLTAGDYVARNIDQFSFRGLVMTAWAFATARHNDPRLFRTIAEQLLLGLDSANCQELANTAWSFATASVHQEALFERLAEESLPRLYEFKPQELSSMLWSFAAIGNQSDDLYVAAGKAAMGIELQAQQLANILWAITKMRPRHNMTQEVVLSLLPRCTRLLHTFKPQELASVALAAGKSFGRIDQEPLSQVPAQVTNFFQVALPLAIPTLREYSAQSLANLTSSLVSLQIGAESDIFEHVGLEIVSRDENSFENSALLLLLKTLPQVPSTPSVRSAIALLFTESSRRVDKLPVREFHILSRICAKICGDEEPSSSTSATWEHREELRLRCQQIANSGGLPTNQFSQANKSDIITAPAPGLHRREVEAPGLQRRGDEDILLYSDAPFVVQCGLKAQDEELGASADKWGSTTLVVAASSQGASIWETEANEQFRQALETSEALREEQARERGDAVEPPSLEETQASQFVVSVKNTFLELEEPAAEDGEPEPDLHLPPALACIPDSVSAEKLEAYRKQYARFRVGQATGARGELDTVS